MGRLAVFLALLCLVFSTVKADDMLDCRHISEQDACHQTTVNGKHCSWCYFKTNPRSTWCTNPDESVNNEWIACEEPTLEATLAKPEAEPEVHADVAKCFGIKDADTCRNNTENGVQCLWCQSKAVKSNCVNPDQAKRLPPAVFVCDAPAKIEVEVAKCFDIKDADTCRNNTENGAQCLWCQSKAVKSNCVNPDQAKRLPPAVFVCDAPAKVETEVTKCFGITDADTCRSSTENGAQCSWCQSKAVKSNCVNPEQAKRLPPAVFVCDAPAKLEVEVAKCFDIKDADTCRNNTENGAQCLWCQSKAVKSNCVNPDQAKRLPPAVFVCDAPAKVETEVTKCFDITDADTCHNSTENGAQCWWCRSNAVKSTCVNPDQAKRLPPPLFVCDDPKVESNPVDKCFSINDVNTCRNSTESGAQCVWCQSKAVPSHCVNPDQAKRLPPAVFVCDATSESMPEMPEHAAVNYCSHSLDAVECVSTGCSWCEVGENQNACVKRSDSKFYSICKSHN